MPLLASLLVSLFSGFASFLTQWFSKKIAFGLAAVAMFGTLTGGLFLTLRSTLNALAGGSSLSGVAAMAFGAAIPPVAPACLSAYTTVWVACTLYKWQTKALDVFVKV